MTMSGTEDGSGGLRGSLPRFPLYHLLLGVWPPLALAALNTSELISAGELLPPVVAGLVVATIAGLALRPVVRDSRRAALGAAAFALFWWFYRPLVSWIQASAVIQMLFLTPFTPQLTLALSVLLSACIAAFSPRSLVNATRFLTVAGLLLVGAACLGVAKGLAERSSALDPSPRPISNSAGAVVPGDPDVYIIVLDSYTGSRLLREHYGFDNSPFERELEARGFTVAAEPRANYAHTMLALPAILNWGYLHEWAPEIHDTTRDTGQLARAATGSRTWRFYHERGYRTVFVPVTETLTGSSPWAEATFAPGPAEFWTAWIRMSPVPEIRRWLGYFTNRWSPDRGGGQRWAGDMEARFRFLAELSRDGAPLFAFAHLLTPHDPYLFHGDCTRRDPPVWRPWSDRSVPTEADTEAYLEQLRCTNLQATGLVDAILKGSSRETVILILSDHGRSMLRHGLVPLEEASPEGVAERLHNFLAVRVPEGVGASFEEVQTPVGAMQVLMREVFGVPLAQDPERSYWSSHLAPFALTQIPAPEGADGISRGPPGTHGRR